MGPCGQSRAILVPPCHVCVKTTKVKLRWLTRIPQASDFGPRASKLCRPVTRTILDFYQRLGSHSATFSKGFRSHIVSLPFFFDPFGPRPYNASVLSRTRIPLKARQIHTSFGAGSRPDKHSRHMSVQVGPAAVLHDNGAVKSN